MKIARVLLVLGLFTSGCAGLHRVDTSVLPAGMFPASDVDEGALNEASIALGSGPGVVRPATAQGMARALADVEYISGAFNTNARWIGMDALAQAQLLMARNEIRTAIGVSDDVPSQAVVNALLAASKATDPAGLLQALGNPIFSLGAAATQARLQAMPPLDRTAAALSRTNQAMYAIMYGGCMGSNC